MTTPIKRNPIAPLDVGWVNRARVNRSAVERRSATITTRRSVKKDWQAAWLLKAVTLIDLTTLAGDDTPGKVQRLCAKGRTPIRQDILDALEIEPVTVAAICVYHSRIKDALAALKGTNIPVAAVSAGFPAGQSSYQQRVDEINDSVTAGAQEIDIVISREHVLKHNWQALYDEVKQFREACGEAHLKTILATGELGTYTNVHKASLVCMMAGADFIKTSTGKESVNATLDVGLIMMRAVRDYHQQTGYKVGFKPAGGISTAKSALQWLSLLKDELGNEWMTPQLFRFGASSLLDDIVRQLSHAATGRYAAQHHIPMG